MVEPCRRGLARLLEAGGWRILVLGFSALNSSLVGATFGQLGWEHRAASSGNIEMRRWAEIQSGTSSDITHRHEQR